MIEIPVDVVFIIIGVLCLVGIIAFIRVVYRLGFIKGFDTAMSRPRETLR